MPTREIKTRFKLEGEQQYKKAMTEAADAIKVLNSEEKLARAEFEATGDAQQYAADQARILKEKIEQQKNAVAAAEDAVRKLTESGVKPNSKEMQTWQTRLNNSRSALKSMESQLDKTESGVKDQNSELTKAKTALSSAEKKVESLTKEEKLAEAQFRNSGDAQQYASDKTRILKEKIDAQKKAVNAAETAIKAMTEKGIDPNSEEMTKWKDKLVDARTKLAVMESQLDKTEGELSDETEGFGKAETAAGSYQKEIEKVNKGIDFQNTITAIDNVTSKIESAAKTVARLATAAVNAAKDAGSWADEVKTAAEQLGIDSETYQSWQYASMFIDTSVSTITKSWQDIQKNLKSNNTEYLAQLAKLGVATKNANGTMKTSEEIFWDIIDALHNIKDPTEQAEKATALFGNDWRELLPLINSGSTAYKNLAEEGKKVAVVSGENVDKLGELDDTFNKLNARADKLKKETLAKLSPAFESVATAADKGLLAIQEFLNSAEGEEAIAELNAAVAGLVDAFLGEDNGKGTLAAIVDGAKDAVKGFTEAVKWIKDNGDKVTVILGGLAGAWAALKVSKEVLTFLQLVKQLPVNKLSQLSGILSGAGKTAGSAAAGKAAGKAVEKATGGSAATDTAKKAATSAGGSAAGKAVVGLGASAILKLATGLGLAAALALKPTSTAGNDLDTLYNDDGSLTTAGSDASWADRMNQLSREREELNGFTQAQKEAAEVFWQYWQKNPMLSGDEGTKALHDFEKAFDGDSEALERMNQMLDDLAEKTDFGGDTSSLPDSFFNTGSSAGFKFAEGVTDAVDQAAPAAESSAVTMGENVAVGLAQGMYNREAEVIRAANALAAAASGGIANKLQIQSPSRVMRGLGHFTGEGFALGLVDETAAVSSAVDKMLAATTRRPAMTMGGISLPASGGRTPGQSGSAAAAGTVHVTMMLDKETIGDVMAPLINDKIGAKVNATRRSY